MVATLIDGRSIAAQLRQDIAKNVASFLSTRGYEPGLAVILVGDNPASQVYVETKKKACESVGIRSDVFFMPKHTHEDEIIDKIQQLNEDESVHGILIQLPLPNAINSSRVIASIAPHKDVDGLHPQNLGYLLAGSPHMVPCTPLGCLHLLQSVMPDMEGKHAIVVGRSVLVGRPTALLLSFKNATVVQAHSHTTDLAAECRRADIIVSAVGKPDMITANHVKPGAVVIDVGITRVNNPDGSSALKGDIAFDEVRQVAGFLTPVPGGVGPMTVAYLLKNTLKAAENS